MASEEHRYWIALFSNTDGTMDFRDRERWFASAQRRLDQIKIDAGMVKALPAAAESINEDAAQVGGS